MQGGISFMLHIKCQPTACRMCPFINDNKLLVLGITVNEGVVDERDQRGMARLAEVTRSL